MISQTLLHHNFSTYAVDRGGLIQSSFAQRSSICYHLVSMILASCTSLGLLRVDDVVGQGQSTRNRLFSNIREEDPQMVGTADFAGTSDTSIIC